MMSKQTDKYQEEEINLKEIIIKFKFYFHEIIRNYLLVLVVTLPLLVYFVYKHYKTLPK